MDTITDHTYYPNRGHEPPCFTCGKLPQEHERSGATIPHDYAYDWGCRCATCTFTHAKRAAERTRRARERA